MKALAGFILIPLLLAAQSQSQSCRSHKATAPATTNVNHTSPTPSPISSPAHGGDAPSVGSNAPPAGISPARANDNHIMSEETHATSQVSQRVARGTWGGAHIRMEVRADGADIEYDCAHGTIDAPLDTDSEGRFDVAGTHVREGGGPIRIGKPTPGQRARYAGRVSEKEMTLTVTLSDTSKQVGTFTLTHDSEGRLWKCR